MKTEITGVIAILLLAFTAISAYLTHLFWVFKVLMADTGTTLGQGILAVLGTFVPPIGTAHGLYLWFM